MKFFSRLFFILFMCLIIYTPIVSANILSNTSESKQSENYYLINDPSNFINDNEKKEITKELSTIFNKNNTTGMTFKTYTFIFEGNEIVSAEKEIISNYNISKNITPIIFIYNLKTKDYKFVIDERIATHISKAYLENLANNVLLSKNNITSSDFKEFLIRFSTISSLAISKDISNQYDLNSKNVKINNDHFEVVDFSKVKPLSNLKSNESNSSSLDKNSSQNNNDKFFYVLLFSIIVTIVVFFKKKRKK